MSLGLMGVSNNVAALATSYILQENGFIILCENNDKLIQE